MEDDCVYVSFVLEIGLFQPVDAPSALVGIQGGVCLSTEIIGKQDRCGGGTPFALSITEPLSWTSLEERRSSERSPLWKTLSLGTWETRLDSFQRALDQV